jgi:hypothetical protein
MNFCEIQDANHAWATPKCEKTSFFDKKSHDFVSVSINKMSRDLTTFSTNQRAFCCKFTISMSVLEGKLLSRWELGADSLMYKFYRDST